MKLPIGARLPHDFAEIPTNDPEIVQRNRALYRITEVLNETPWSCLYRAKKVFRNYEFSRNTLTEAGDDECLDVLIRTLSYTRTDDRGYVKARRDHSWFEAKRVLGCRRTNLIPEPLDYLELRNDQDQFEFPRPGKIPTTEPVLVFETIHGINLARWRQSSAAKVRDGLYLVAQMVEFLGTLHGESLLANVVSPASFWVDELRRIHFLGTENVVDEKHAGEWRILFPIERYAQGFFAPELLTPTQPSSRQSDLYGLAALTWFLLTGDSPAQMASEQQQRWTRFEGTHRTKLKQILQQLSSAEIAEIKRELGVVGNRFEALWPDSFLDGLWPCFEADPMRRPGSIVDLRQWWGNPPLPSVPACLAVRRKDGTAHIAFSTEGLNRDGVQFRIVRRFEQAPESIDEGEVVWTGVAGECVEAKIPASPGARQNPPRLAEWCFSVFVIEMDTNHGELTLSRDGSFKSVSLSETVISASRPTVVKVIDGSVPRFRQTLAESLATNTEILPAEVALLSLLDPVEIVADELLASCVVRVRQWATALLERGLKNNSFDACFRRIEQRCLTDSDYTVRWQAAGALFRATPLANAATIVDLSQRLAGHIDEMIRAARNFAAFGVSARVIDAAIETLEQHHRIVVCKVCQGAFRLRDLDAHLTTDHGYVPIDGMLLPLGRALQRLWSRILNQFDECAVTRLTELLQERHLDDPESALASALAQQFLQTENLVRTFSQDESRYEDLARCLRIEKSARKACRFLLAHNDHRIRQLARQVLLPDVASRLAEEHVIRTEFREAIDRLVPLGSVSDRIQVCHQLVKFGANSLVGDFCERELDLERLVDCPECGTSLRKRDLPRHRRLHHLRFEWEGRDYDRDGLTSLLLSRVVSGETDAFAARSLEELFVEQFSDGAAMSFYRELRMQILECARQGDVAALASGIGPAIGTLELSETLSRSLLADDEAACRTIGLSVFTHLGGETSANLAYQAAACMSDNQVPEAIAQMAAIHLLRQPGTPDDVNRGALRAIAKRAEDKLLGIDRLRALEQWVGTSSVIDSVCADLMSQIRMTCPRCGDRMTPSELANHVIAQHQLILDGRTVRKPWSVALECLEAYADDPDEKLLKRAEEMSVIAAPKTGKLKFRREALRRGIAPRDFQDDLIASIEAGGRSLCPECWESISTGETPINVVRVDESGNIESPLVSIKRVGLHGLWSSVEVSPWNGEQPRWVPSRLGAIVATAILFLLPTLILGVFFLQRNAEAKLYMQGGFLLGTIGMLCAAVFYRPRSADPIDVAWRLVVPQLIEDVADSNVSKYCEFLAGLARVSCDRGDSSYRHASLNDTVRLCNNLVNEAVIPASRLGDLLRLLWEDALKKKSSKRTRQSTLCELVQGVLQGRIPLECLDAATQNGATVARLPRNQLIAVVWYLVAEAKSDGLVPADLGSLADSSKTISSILNASSIPKSALAGFYATLELEESGKWPKRLIAACNLLSSGQYEQFKSSPALLAQSTRHLATSNGDMICLWADYVTFNEMRITARTELTIRRRVQFVQTGWTYQRVDGGPDRRYSYNPPTGYERLVGYTLEINNTAHDYASDPTPIVDAIREICCFQSQALAPTVAKWSRLGESARLTTILAKSPVRCPHCKTLLRLRDGKIADRANAPNGSDRPHLIGSSFNDLAF